MSTIIRVGGGGLEEKTASVFLNKFPAVFEGFAVKTTTTYYVPKVFTYYNGYYWMAGVTSAGLPYISYSTNLTSWSTKKISSTAFPVNAFGLDVANGHAWLFGNDIGAGKKGVLGVDNLFDTIKTVAWDNSPGVGVSFTDAVSYNDVCWALTGTATAAIGWTDASEKVLKLRGITHGSLTNMKYCCMYNATPVGLQTDGQYGWRQSISPDAYSLAGSGRVATDLNCLDIEQMGDYLCVLGSKSDGLYLYYATGAIGALNWKSNKISETTGSSIGMAFANGLYIVAYKDASGVTKLWASETIDGVGDTLALASNMDGYTLVDLSTNGTTAASAAYTSAKNGVAYYAVP